MHPVDELTQELCDILERADRNGGVVKPFELHHFVMKVREHAFDEAGTWLKENWKDTSEHTAEPGRVLADEMVNALLEGR